MGFLEKLGGNGEKRRPWNKFNFGAIEDGGIQRGSSGLKRFERPSQYVDQGLCCSRAIDRMCKRCEGTLALHNSRRDIPVSV